MTFFTLTRPGGPWDYSTLGFTAINGAVLDGSLSTPPVTVPPDAYWAVAGAAEAGITRHGSGTYSAAPVAEPADGAALVWDATDNRYVPASLPTLPKGTNWPIYLYGNSYSILTGIGSFTPGRHYSQMLATALGFGSCTSYGVGAKRILDVLSALINESPITGLITAPVAGSKWPGTSARSGLIVLESLVNDFGHYPSMQGAAVAAALPSGNTRYRDVLASMYRAALAVMSSESRVEQSARTATSGTWSNDISVGYASGGSVSFTSAAGAYHEYSITPPQSGPLAGKVFKLAYTLDPAVGAVAQQIVAVDGVTQTTYTPSAWEQYTGPTGAQVNTAIDCLTVTLPIDGAAHTVRVTHNGSGGQFMYADCFLVPSVTPNPIVIPGAEHALATVGWTGAQRATYTANEKVLTPVIKAVAAEFPNVVWAPSNMTAAGLYSADGIHPNDLGMKQRESDIANALVDIKSLLDARALAAVGGYAIT